MLYVDLIVRMYVQYIHCMQGKAYKQTQLIYINN